MAPGIRPLIATDAGRIAAAFDAVGGNKPVEKYDGYLAEQQRGERAILVAETEGQFAGYVTVKWVSDYPSFRDDDVPEIQDLNVLPSTRRQGVGSALMDAAEALVSERGDVVGIGVGMDPDYGPAQAMYVRRGYVPDACGLTSQTRHVQWGDTVTVNDHLVLYFTKRLRRPPTAFPERATPRLILRPVRIDDAPSVYQIYSNAEVCEFFDVLPYTREVQAEAHVRRWIHLAERGRQIRYAIALDGKVVGTCGLYSIYRHQNRACLGCDLHPDYWKQGLMTEALEEFLGAVLWGLGLHPDSGPGPAGKPCIHCPPHSPRVHRRGPAAVVRDLGGSRCGGPSHVRESAAHRPRNDPGVSSPRGRCTAVGFASGRESRGLGATAAPRLPSWLLGGKPPVGGDHENRRTSPQSSA